MPGRQRARIERPARGDPHHDVAIRPPLDLVFGAVTRIVDETIQLTLNVVQFAFEPIVAARLLERLGPSNEAVLRPRPAEQAVQQQAR